MASIDLNADLGETVNGVPTADDEAMFEVISSASIACGGHAGDAISMRRAVELAGVFGVAVGAHPSFVDRENFGRLALDLPPALLQVQIREQLLALTDAGADIRYVKPHGALYHRVSADRAAADAIVAEVAALAAKQGHPVPLLGMGDVVRAAATAGGVSFVAEAYLDRGYQPDGRLVPRTAAGALLSDPDEVAARAVRLVTDGVVLAIDGTQVRADAASLCMHGDSPGAVVMARAVRAALTAASVTIRAPW